MRWDDGIRLTSKGTNFEDALEQFQQHEWRTNASDGLLTEKAHIVRVSNFH